MQQSNIKYKWCYIGEIKDFDIRNNYMTAVLIAESYYAEVKNNSPFYYFIKLNKKLFWTLKKFYRIKFLSSFKIIFY